MVQDIYLRFRIYTQGSGYKYSWFRIDILRVQDIYSECILTGLAS